MDNLRDQLGSLSIDNVFLTVLNVLTGMNTCLVTLCLHLLLECSAEIVLIFKNVFRQICVLRESLS